MKKDIRYSKDGRSCNVSFWYLSGQIESITHYKNGERDGYQKSWYKNGIVKSESNYKNGKLDGDVIKRYPNGKICARYSYHDGELTGIAREWNDSGKLVYAALNVLTFEDSREEYMTEEETYMYLLKHNNLSVKDIICIENADIRHVMVKEIGYEKFYLALPKKIIDTEEDMELVEIDWHQDEEPFYFVKVRCPSTGTFYVLRVPPSMENVKQAIAWTFDVDEYQYCPGVET